MIKQPLERLAFLCSTVPAKLLQLNEAELSEKPAPEKWSKKEIIGHLIDSAANNHQRFVRAQFEERPSVFYDQDKWNSFSYYQDMSGKQIIDFWLAYNLHLVELLKRMPDELLDKTCRMSNGEELTLTYLVTDYVDHLEHHLHAVIEY